MLHHCPHGATMSRGGSSRKGKSKRKKCRNCRNLTPVRKSGPRAGKSKGALCHKCRARVWRSHNPMRAAYLRLKAHAKNRGIEFTLSFPYFRRFAEKTQLLTRGGLHREAVTVDRKDNLRGYVPGNIQPLTRAKNSEKRARQDQIRFERGYAWASMYC